MLKKFEALFYQCWIIVFNIAIIKIISMINDLNTYTFQQSSDF